MTSASEIADDRLSSDIADSSSSQKDSVTANSEPPIASQVIENPQTTEQRVEKHSSPPPLPAHDDDNAPSEIASNSTTANAQPAPDEGSEV